MSISVFGHHPNGQPVEKIDLQVDGFSASILTLGAILQDVRVPTVPYSLTLGSPDFAAYIDSPFAHFGAIMGPVANRIRHAEAVLGGEVLQFERNVLGKHVLHGGSAAFHHRIWTIEDHSDTHLTLSLETESGSGGFPGSTLTKARFEVAAPAQLTLTLTGETDAPTFLNLANHSYWNLDGSPTFEGHTLQVAAAQYLPTDEDYIPLGEVRDVTGTAFDFQTPRELQPGVGGLLDNNLCLASERRELSHAATLSGRSGVSLQMLTTEPGLQIYDAWAQATAPFAGHQGAPYPAYAGLALEAQMWPNAPNEPGFPSIEITPDRSYQQITRWVFAEFE